MAPKSSIWANQLCFSSGLLIRLNYSSAEIFDRCQGLLKNLTQRQVRIMLLLMVEFQSVHEPTGPSEGYLQLEELVKQVVSPYLGLCEDHGFPGSTCLLGKSCASYRSSCWGVKQCQKIHSAWLHEKQKSKVKTSWPTWWISNRSHEIQQG